MRAKLSILGLYQADPTIFNDMSLPVHTYMDENDQEQTEPALDKDVLINNLLMDLSELCVIITNPVTMKLAIKSWSAACLDVWQEMWDTTQYDYNPIWNKDGTFKEKETHNLASTDNESRDLNNTDNTTVTGSVAAYTSNTLQTAEQAVTGGNVRQAGYVNKSGSDTGYIERERTEQGNIGLTSTQQLITEQREVVKFNMYNYIIEDFKHRFCIMVY